MRAVVCAGFVLLGLFAVGCGPSSWDDFRGQLTDKWCARQVRCGAIGASERVSCGPPTQLLRALAPGPLDVDEALKSGRLRFVSSGAQDCLDAVNGAPCDPNGLAARVIDRCHDVLQPNLEPGKTCLGPGECVGGACVVDGTGCKGTCQPYGPPGHPCDDSGALKTACDPTVQYCGLEQAAPDLGLPDGGAPDAGARVCLRHRQEGDACFRDEECPFGLVCLGTCQRQPSLKEGDLCGAPGTLCTDDSYCDATNRCVRRLGDGAACRFPLACRDQLVCVGYQQASPMKPGVDGACRPWLDLGAACTTTNTSPSTGCPLDSHCGSFNAQPGTPGTCEPFDMTSRAGLKQPCSGANSCADGLACDGTTCRFAIDALGDCSGAARATLCSSGLTCDGTTCQPPSGSCPF